MAFVTAADRAYLREQRAYWSDRDEAHFRFQVSAPYLAKTEAALVAQAAPTAAERLLEIGCGEGGNLFHVGQARLAEAGSGPRLFGIDFSARKAAFAKDHLLQAGFPVETAAADATRLPFADESFDVVLIRDLLHHLQDRKGALREALRVLRIGGRLLLIEPNGRSPLVLLQMALIKEERGALGSTAARLAAELTEVGFVIGAAEPLQPLPVSRVILHPRFGLPALGLRHPAAGLDLLYRALHGFESLCARLVPRPLWLYLRFTAVRPGAPRPPSDPR